jgi:DNA polymerase III sliding clamp (beta) subunit (PCNA family)
MIEINSSHFSAVASFRAKNNIRFCLNSVLLETGPNGAYLVATDGHALAVARINSAAMPESQVLIGADIVAMLAKQKNAVFVVTMPEQTGKFDAENGKRKISVETLAYMGASTMAIEESEGIFPDWRRVARHEYKTETVAFSPDLIKRVDDAARLIKNTKKGKVAAHIRPGGDGCGFATLDDDGLVCAWVMPMRESLSELPSSPAFTI